MRISRGIGAPANRYHPGPLVSKRSLRVSKRVWIGRFVVSCAMCLGVCAPARAQDAPIAFVGAQILPVDGPPIENGILIVQDGKIVSVGPVASTTIPADMYTIDVTGKVIMPGLVDTHSHIGGIGGADGSGPIQPGVRVYDSINAHDSGFQRALSGGLTTLNIMPGSGHLSSGQTVYVKLRLGTDDPKTIEHIAYQFPDGSPMGGLKMANGTNSIREDSKSGFPGTRAKSAFLVREAYIKAQEYRDKIKAAGDDTSKMPPRDLNLETMVQAMDGERIVHHHTHRADDILTVIRLSKEFGFPVVLHHVSEAWAVADEIAAAGVPCSVILVDSPGGKLEAKNMSFETGGILERAGVLVAYHTDDWITDSRLFLRMGALGIRGGMTRETALKALTLNGAKILRLDDRIGSITPGKDADLVILSGDPFSVYTRVEQTWVEGKKVFDLSNPTDALYAEGGYGAVHDSVPYFCCFDHLIHGDNADHAHEGGE